MLVFQLRPVFFSFQIESHRTGVEEHGTSTAQQTWQCSKQCLKLTWTMLKMMTSHVPCVWRYLSVRWPHSADIHSVTAAFRSACGLRNQCVQSAGLICASGIKQIVYKTWCRDQSGGAKAVQKRFFCLTWEATQEFAPNIKTISRMVWSPYQRTNLPLSVQCRTGIRSPVPSVSSRTLTRMV